MKNTTIAFIFLLSICNFISLASESQPREKENWQIILDEKNHLEMIYIEPGSFNMGSPNTELGRNIDEQLHQVILDSGYWIGKYEVTLSSGLYRLGKSDRTVSFEVHPAKTKEKVITDVITVNGKRRPRVNGQKVYFNSYIGAFYDQRRFAFPFLERGIDSVLTFDGSWARGACNSAWIGDGKYDFSRITAQIERFVSLRPDLKLIIGIGVDAPGWWAAKHPDELIRFAGSRQPEQLSSPASLLLRRESGVALRASIRFWENSHFAIWFFCSSGKCFPTKFPLQASAAAKWSIVWNFC